MTRPRRMWLLGLVLAAVPFPAPAPSFPDSAIVPSRAIGPYRLGMSAAEVQRLAHTAPCAVRASYIGGQVSRLETNCGGAYRTPETVQVGDGPNRMLAAYGTPERRSESSFGGVRGEWLHYRTGIAFRLVYGDESGGGLIQAIAVFRGTAPYRVRPVPPMPVPAPAPLPSPGGD